MGKVFKISVKKKKDHITKKINRTENTSAI